MEKKCRDFINELKTYGIDLWVLDGKLKYKAPKGKMNDEIRKKIALMKEELINILSQEDMENIEDIKLTKISKDGKLPLSFAQERLWFLQQLLPESPFYNVPITSKLFGKIDFSILEKSINILMKNNEILRANFKSVDGKPYQIINENTEVKLEIIDLSDFSEEVREEEAIKILTERARIPFDIEKELLVKALLLKMDKDYNILSINTHHLVVDGWSLKLITKEIYEIYDDLINEREVSLGEKEFNYVDFAAWERKVANTNEIKNQLEYWKEKLRDIPESMDMPTDKVRPARETFNGSMESAIFTGDIAEKIKKFSRDNRVTAYVTVLAAVYVLLNKYTNKEDVILATPVSTRRTEELENIIGTFMNTLVLRGDLSGNPTFSELLERVTKVIVEAMDNQAVSFEKVVDEVQKGRSLNSAPLFQILFLFENLNSAAISLPNVKSENVNIALGTSRFDIVLLVTTTEKGLEVNLEYSTDLFNADTIKRFILNLEKVLSLVIDNPEKRISEFEVISDKEKSLLESINSNNGASDDEKTFIDVFEKVAEINKDVPAVRYMNNVLTYKELNEEAENIAKYLRYKNISRGDYVGIYMDRSEKFIVSLIAILKAGATYVPIDFAYPKERVSYIVNDAKLKGVIVNGSDVDLDIDRNVEILDLQKVCSVDENLISSKVKSSPDDIMYVIYTSGTTGNPKGVQITHKSILNLVQALEKEIYCNYKNIQNVGVNGSLSFDTSVKQLIQLLNGRTLCIVPEANRYDAESFINFIEENQVNIIDATPMFTDLLLNNREFSKIRNLVMLIGGENINKNLWEKMRSINSVYFYNMYGPSECTVDTTVALIKDNINPTIGKPILNTKVYILDKNMNKVPIGVYGEIYIGGIGVGKGYLNNEKLTSDKFINHTFNDGVTEYIYKTGDVGRYLNDGNIEFKGRVDNQVKVRGFRIELNEIESVLESHESIEKAAVTVLDEDGDKSIYAYILPDKYDRREIDGYKRYNLDNGLNIVHLNRNETDFLYDDIFKKIAYYKNGIHVNENSTIFDVGANIGLFSLQTFMQEPSVKIFSFEPNPYIRKLLKINCELYNINSTVFDYAVSSEEGETEFTFYPKFSLLSGLYADYDEEKELVKSYVKKHNDDGEEIEEEIEDDIEEIIEDKLQSIKIPVKLVRLSDIIDEYNVDKIDLLKINVEKSELEVLLGINPEHWKRINQVVLELHDFDNRLEKVLDLLKTNGFEVIVEQDWSLENVQNIYYLYAVKEKVNKNIEFKYKPKKLLGSDEIRQYLSEKLPKYMVPSNIKIVDNIPLTINGKVDFKELTKNTLVEKVKVNKELPRNRVEEEIHKIWSEVLKKEDIDIDDNFFDIGGHSLLLAQVHSRILKFYSGKLTVLELFEYPTIRLLAERLSGEKVEDIKVKPIEVKEEKNSSDEEDNSIAIIGITGRFPNSKSKEEFWENLKNEIECISEFRDVKTALSSNELYVPRRGILSDIELFDANFFGYTPREAEITDPQQRLFLECSYEVLEKAGYNTLKYKWPIGVFGGVTLSTYLFNNLLKNHNVVNSVDFYQMQMLNDKDHFATRVAYKLNLTGPAITVQTSCSTSLVAVNLACKSILKGECKMALVGGSTVVSPQKSGYLYREGAIFSKDGKCRAFDDKASGTVAGNAVAVVLLKKLDAAIKDRDNIYAVIKGSAINNDGNRKVGYTAPSISGQVEVIRDAIADAKVSPESISYVETHGTGTNLGDPIELRALQEVFGNVSKEKYCGIGSVKTNVGHLDAAAGIVNLIKVALALKNEEIPATINFEEGNRNIDWENNSFYVVDKLKEWKRSEKVRRAGVSAFGIGGTNAHVILEEAPIIKKEESKNYFNTFVLSAKSETALENMKNNILAYLENNKDTDLSDIAYTLQVGRREFNNRWTCVCKDRNELIDALTSKDVSSVRVANVKKEKTLVFAFPGQGSQFVKMGKKLYETQELYRASIDKCANILQKDMNLDIRNVLFGDDENIIKETYMTQVLLFVTEYAMAKFLIDCGVKPTALIGHSLGEYVAACIAGVFTLEDALFVISNRGRIMQKCKKGTMLALAINKEEVKKLLSGSLELAVVNGEKACVVSGDSDDIDKLIEKLEGTEIKFKLLKTSHGFHSAKTESILDEFFEVLNKVSMNKPKIPYMSNYTGDWIKDEEATSAKYWIRHTRNCVRFNEDINNLISKYGDINVVEVGPGNVLSNIISSNTNFNINNRTVTLMPRVEDDVEGLKKFFIAISELWGAGLDIDWEVLNDGKRFRVELPTYPFEKEYYWISPDEVNDVNIDVKNEDSDKTINREYEEVEKIQHSRPDIPTVYVEPRNDTEKVLATIWMRSIGINKVGIYDEYFSLGGDSLSAISLIDEIKKKFNCEISIKEFFKDATINYLSTLIIDEGKELSQEIDEQLTEQQILDNIDNLSSKEIDELLKRYNEF